MPAGSHVPEKRTHYLAGSVISRVFLGESKYNQLLRLRKSIGIGVHRNAPLLFYQKP